MKGIKYIITFFLAGAILLLQSCIFSYEPNIPAGDTRVLVVEGQITKEVGPFRVKLSRSFDIDNMQLYGEPETGAQVEIFDDKGNLFPLYYTSNGWYETEDTLLQGVPGNTYTLNITTAGGTQYESTPELMLDVPEIDSLYFEEVTKTRFEDGKAIDENWLDIFVDAHDNAGQTNYWKWDFEETWEVRTPKDSIAVIFKPDNAPQFTVIMNVEFIDGNPKKGWDNKKERCWVHVNSKTILIASTQKSSIDKIEKFRIKSIEPKNDRLDIQYSILVKQSALSQDLYNFWKELKELNKLSGNLYDKLPSQIFGNISCCNSEKKALGYFHASAVRSKRIIIHPYEHNMETENPYTTCWFQLEDPRPFIEQYYLGHIVAVGDLQYSYFIGQKLVSREPWCPDCREYGSNIKPDYWEEKH